MQETTHPATELIALSFDGRASPSFALPGDQEAEPGSFVSTWGLGWYPDNQRAASVLRNIDVPAGTMLSRFLQDASQFRSSLFLGLARGVGVTSTDASLQLFMRAYAGRQWLFGFAGEFSPDVKSSLELGEAFDVAPVGASAGEHVLSWLLVNLRDRSAKTIDEYGWREIHALLRRVNELGSVSLLLSDGHDLVAYRDANEDIPFHWTRVAPPHEQTKLHGRSFLIDLDTPMDASRTLFAFSTLPMRGAKWKPMELGEMRVARRGTSVWSSHPADIDEQIFSHLGFPRKTMPPGDKALYESQQQQQLGHGPIVPTGAPVSPPPLEDPSMSIGLSPPCSPSSSLSAAPPDAPSNPKFGQASDDAILSVVHVTTYRYDFPVERSSHRFCLSPVHDERQVVLDHSLEISVDGTSRDFEDVFGNRARVLEVTTPFTEMTITSRSRARVRGVSASDLKWPHDRTQIPLVWMPWQRQMMHAYLLPAELPESELRELSEFGMSFVDRNDQDIIETLLDLNRTIYRDFQYVPGSTTIETTPYSVYKNRKGVCQDFANVLICVARLLGVPARYRVGYIYTGGSYENKIQSDASHAWAEVYLPMRGWLGFDPTNGCLAGSDHLRVGCGRQFGDAAPTAGMIYRGGGGERLSVDVRVERTESSEAMTREI